MASEAQAGGPGAFAYEPPHIEAHGSVAEVTQAFLIGIFIDKNHSQGDIIIGNTSL